MRKILFGIDGGGSNAKLLITDYDLNILDESRGGATNFHKIGLEKAVINIQNLVEPFLAKYNGDAEIVLVIGTAGAGRKNDAEKLEVFLKENLLGLKRIKVLSDAEITLRGAFENENGAILIAGTGSILYYKLDSKINRVGGFGRLIGDEGSGYTIGRRGLNILSKMLDGRIQKTLLNKLAEENFEISSQHQLITKLYRENFDIAAFAEIVIEAAEKKEENCLKIIEEETDELINHLKVMMGNIKSEQINLILSGGLVESESYFIKILMQKIQSEIPQIKIANPKHRPEYGAVLVAKYILKENE